MSGFTEKRAKRNRGGGLPLAAAALALLGALAAPMSAYAEESFEPFAEEISVEEERGELIAGDTEEAAAIESADAALMQGELIQDYVCSYLIEYNGRQLKEVSGAVSVSELTTFEADGETRYAIDPNTAFFRSEEARRLFKGNSDAELGILGYTIVMNAAYRDGSAVAGGDGLPVEEKRAEVSKTDFEENGYALPVIFNDVLVYARVGAFAAQSGEDMGVAVTAPSGVRYCGLPHKLSADPAAKKPGASKSAAYDIGLSIVDKSAGEDAAYALVYGRDYTASYKNNKEASVRFTGNSADKDYVQCWGEYLARQKWPQVIVKGKGNYAGLNAVIYFDILPASLSEGCGAAGPFADGAAEYAALKKNGGIALNPAPVRYGRVYDASAETYLTDYARLVRYAVGKDITLTLEKKNSASDKWERFGDLTDGSAKSHTLSAVSDTGEYRLAVKGIGNYTGTVYDSFSVISYGAAAPAVNRQKLSAEMFSPDWQAAGEAYDGKTKDITVSLKGIAPADLSSSLIRAAGEGSIVLDGEAMKNSAPGTYRAILYGKNRFAGSAYTLSFVRLPIVLEKGMVSAEDAEFNAGGALPEITIHKPDGTAHLLKGGGDSFYKVTCKNNKAIGEKTATAQVTVLDPATGFKKGASVSVSFSVKRKTVTAISDHSAFKPGEPGGLYVKTPGFVRSGKRAPASRLYQADAEGKKLVEVPGALYAAEYVRTQGSLADDAFSVKLTGKSGALLFPAEGISLPAYVTYKAEAKKWSAPAELKLGSEAYLIRSSEAGKEYTSADIDPTLKTTAVSTNGRGGIFVDYAGGCLILPVIEELKVDGNTLRFAEGDLLLRYQRNDRAGTAKLIVSLTEKAVRQYGSYGSKTYSFTIRRQKNAGLIL